MGEGGRRRSRLRRRTGHGSGGAPVVGHGSPRRGDVASASWLTHGPPSPPPPLAPSGKGRRGGGLRFVASLALILITAGTACGRGEESPPRPISAASPFRYPVPQWDAGEEGDVVLMVHVTAMGSADTAYVVDGSGEPAFHRAALAGVKKLMFAPARRGDERVAAWVRLPVRFSMSGGPEATDAQGPAAAAEPPDTAVDSAASGA